MSEKELLMQATILIPCNFSKELDEVQEEMWKGVMKAKEDLVQNHPDASELVIYNTLINIILTNWAITGMALHQRELEYRTVVETLKSNLTQHNPH